MGRSSPLYRRLCTKDQNRAAIATCGTKLKGGYDKDRHQGAAVQSHIRPHDSDPLLWSLEMRRSRDAARALPENQIRPLAPVL